MKPTNFSVHSFEEIDRPRILAALELMRAQFLPSPLERLGEVWAKFESDVPTGAFKIRGGLVYFQWLKANHPEVRTVVAATRGNHGQSVALAAAQHAVRCRIVVPQGNSLCKNEAMRALGAELIEHGRDFAESLEFAQQLATQPATHFVPSFDWKLVLGVATYGYEMFTQLSDVDAVLVPIGLGSGICGTLAARRAAQSDCTVIGVVAEEAPVYAESFAAKRIVQRQEIPQTIADGVACRAADPAAFEVIAKYVDSVVTVGEDEIRRSIIDLHQRTSRRIEGAGALAWAALQRLGARYRRPAVIVSGGNISDAEFAALRQ